MFIDSSQDMPDLDAQLVENELLLQIDRIVKYLIPIIIWYEENN